MVPRENLNQALRLSFPAPEPLRNILLIEPAPTCSLPMTGALAACRDSPFNFRTTLMAYIKVLPPAGKWIDFRFKIRPEETRSRLSVPGKEALTSPLCF